MLASLLLLGIGGYVHAQSANMTQPKLWVGKIPSYVETNGKRELPTATIDQILSDARFYTDMPDSKILSYTISAKPLQGGDIVGPFNINGSNFSTEAKAALEKLKGHKGILELENVKFEGADGQHRTVAPMYIRYNG